MNAYDFHALGIDLRGRTGGRIKTFCPQCHHSRQNKADKSLSVDLDNGLYYCHYCQWSGHANDGTNPHMRQPGEPLVNWKEARTAPPAPPPPAALSPAIPSSAIPSPAEENLPLSREQKEYLTHIRKLPLEAVAQLGITAAHHFMPQTGRKELCFCFHFVVDGQRINTKYRTLNGKNFALVAGAELTPYNIDAIANTTTCVIVEGEYDVAACVAAGRTDVISVPNGANTNLTWMDRFAESHFENKRIIYIAVDTDTKGVGLKNELLRRLGVERCRVVSFGTECKDANELLVGQGPEALLQAIETAPEFPLEGVFDAHDVTQELRALFENGLKRGAETGLENFDTLCTMETGRLCVVTGYPGDGKSEFVDELVLRLCIRHHWRAAFFSPENEPLPIHLSKLFEKLTGCKFKQGYLSERLYQEAYRFACEHLKSILPKKGFLVESILMRARELVSRRGIRILVIDPFNKLEHDIPPGQTETQYISAFLDRLTNFAQQNQCLVILVAHPRKMQRDARNRFPVIALQDINGSAAFVNKCDFGLVVERDREVGVTRVHVKKVKFRHLGRVGECSFVYNTTNGRYSPCRENPDADPDHRVTGTEFDNQPWIGQQGAEVKQGTLGLA